MAFLGMGRGDNPVAPMTYTRMQLPGMPEQSAAERTGFFGSSAFGTGMDKVYADPSTQALIQQMVQYGEGSPQYKEAKEGLNALVQQLGAELPGGAEFAVTPDGRIGMRYRDVNADYLYPAATLGTMALGGAAGASLAGGAGAGAAASGAGSSAAPSAAGLTAGAGGASAATGMSAATMGSLGAAPAAATGAGAAAIPSASALTAGAGGPSAATGMSATAASSLGPVAGTASGGAAGGSMYGQLISGGMQAAGAGMQAYGNAQASEAAAQAERERQAMERNQLSLLRGPSPQAMALAGQLADPANRSNMTYTPGEGYSQPHAYDLGRLMAGLQPTWGPEAQQANTAAFETARGRAQEDPRLSLARSEVENPMLFQPDHKWWRRDTPASDARQLEDRRRQLGMAPAPGAPAGTKRGGG